MRKIVVCSIVVVSLILSACGSKQESNKSVIEHYEDVSDVSTNADIDALKGILQAQDRAGLRTKLIEIEDLVKKYIREDNLLAAQEFADALQAFLYKHSNELKAIGALDNYMSILNGVKDIIGTRVESMGVENLTDEEAKVLHPIEAEDAREKAEEAKEQIINSTAKLLIEETKGKKR